MENTKEILTELQEIAPFLRRAGFIATPYQTPEGFFEDFAGILMLRIQIEASGGLDLTDGGLRDRFSSLEEISEISPLLAGIQKKNPYQAPSGYFESLKVSIRSSEPVLISGSDLNRSQSSGSGGKRIPLFSGKGFRYGIAACLVALLGTFLLFKANQGNPTDPINGLSNVSARDMANFLDSDDIHWTPSVSPSETASVDFSEGDIHALFSSISDEELVQYLPSSVQKGTVN